MKDKGRPRTDLHEKGNGIGKRLFTSSKQKGTSTKVLHATSSPTGYYINYCSLSNNKSSTTIVGKNIKHK